MSEVYGHWLLTSLPNFAEFTKNILIYSPFDYASDESTMARNRPPASPCKGCHPLGYNLGLNLAPIHLILTKAIRIKVVTTYGRRKSLSATTVRRVYVSRYTRRLVTARGSLATWVHNSNHSSFKLE